MAQTGDTITPLLRKTIETELVSPTVKKGSYPSIKSIPRTSSKRLEREHPDKYGLPSDRPTTIPMTRSTCDGMGKRSTRRKDKKELVPAGEKTIVNEEEETTVLYLAYGSNMSAKTFLGMRGIRPLSSIPVSAPSLTLTFDLPGLPYLEPCFANVAPRVLKDPPKIPDKPPFNPPYNESLRFTPAQQGKGEERDRNGGGLPDIPGGIPDVPGGIPKMPKLPPELIGVVYEVTAADYSKIVATEGGGASYAQILVPCLPLPPSVSIPEKPAVPEPVRPFLAHTLCVPQLPDLPDDDNDDDDDGDNPSPPKKWKKYLAFLLLPVHRPDPSYAQPSLRYLSLLRMGAQEHDLPQHYQDYLASLQPYTITSCRQMVGRWLFILFWMPMFVWFVLISKLVADRDTGLVPVWVAGAMTVLSHAEWGSYDAVFKRMFGDGEHTQKKDGEGQQKGDGVEEVGGNECKWRRRASLPQKVRRLSGTQKHRQRDEEKRGLLGEVESESD